MIDRFRWMSERFDKGQDARRVARDKAAKPGATQKIGDKRVKLLARAEKRDWRSES